ncbi:MAG: hypothetical protein JRJ87_26130 [Deltaproteobacteria bacterium]|nr:hypothetical protein [Deltaproteobacteria bacterium]
MLNRMLLLLVLILPVAFAGLGCAGSDSCVTGSPCETSEDCENGQRCNLMLDPPACQVLYCGSEGVSCSEDIQCATDLVCSGAVCSGSKKLYEMCESDAQCESQTCRTFSITSQTLVECVNAPYSCFCTTSCQSDSPCQQEGACIEFTGGDSMCAKSCSTHADCILDCFLDNLCHTAHVEFFCKENDVYCI